jgi:hypothetical protein
MEPERRKEEDVKRHWTPAELTEHRELRPRERELVEAGLAGIALAARDAHTRLGFACLLKYFQLEGRFPRSRAGARRGRRRAGRHTTPATPAAQAGVPAASVYLVASRGPEAGGRGYLGLPASPSAWGSSAAEIAPLAGVGTPPAAPRRTAAPVIGSGSRRRPASFDQPERHRVERRLVQRLERLGYAVSHHAAAPTPHGAARGRHLQESFSQGH